MNALTRVVVLVSGRRGVALAAAAWRPRNGPRAARPAAKPALPALPAGHQEPQALDHRRQVRRAAVRLHRREGQATRASTSRSRTGSPATRSARRTASSFVCAPTPAREPPLTTGRVDLVISTFTYTRTATRASTSRARTTRRPGRLLVRNDSPIHSLSDLAGRRVATTSGSIYDRWVPQCFTGTDLPVTDNLTNARLAFRPGPRRHADVGRHRRSLGIAVGRRNLKLTERPLPLSALRHRHAPGLHRDEALGRLAARADAEERPVHARSSGTPSPRAVRRLRSRENILRPNVNVRGTHRATRPRIRRRCCP